MESAVLLFLVLAAASAAAPATPLCDPVGARDTVRWAAGVLGSLESAGYVVDRYAGLLDLAREALGRGEYCAATHYAALAARAALEAKHYADAAAELIAEHRAYCSGLLCAPADHAEKLYERGLYLAAYTYLEPITPASPPPRPPVPPE